MFCLVRVRAIGRIDGGDGERGGGLSGSLAIRLPRCPAIADRRVEGKKVERRKMHLLATSNKNPKMHVLICNFHWSRSQKYTKDLQLHIRVLVAGREYSRNQPASQRDRPTQFLCLPNE
ncbi:hypothetical protein P167DRAFT_187875 [Morchella conica CCBAS932]|uniref:Uncharacterized protein n=1 Tax=Morchella conica CCBAS932 TaxID=1392247 RepID=A0A3N4KMZ2_9PEZI|nr:hypothetical protein P167DRAFT_187875 [Morchella conica CCBAS932]